MFRTGQHILSHPHGHATTAGYLVVLTDWTDGHPCTRTVVAEIAGATNYAAALDAVKALRAQCTATQYGVIDTVYICGCDSGEFTPNRAA